MEQQQLVLDEYLVRGLRPHADVPRNSPYMEKYTNLMACERRAKQLPSFTWPAGFPTVSTSWPLAEGFFNERVSLAVVDNDFYTLNISALTSAGVTLYDAETPASSFSVSGSGSWHFAAFLDMWLATNGTSLVYKLPSTDSNKVVGHSDNFACNSLCNWENRLVFGGLSGTRFSDASWTRFFNLWTLRDKNVVTSEDDTFDTTWLLIGPRVGGDPGIPNSSVMALLGLPSDTAYTTVFEPRVLEWAEQGEIDLFPCRFTGAIQCVREYEGDLIVFGADGISRIRRTEAGLYEEKIGPVGIWGRASVGGTPRELLCVGQDGNLYMTGEAAMRYAKEGVYSPERVGTSFFRLGFSEFIGTLNSGTRADFLYVVFDPTEQRYWVSFGDGAYLLSKTGLSFSLGVVPSSLFRLPGSTLLLGSAKTNLSGNAAVELTTVAVDMGRRDPFNVGRLDLTTTDTASSESDRWKVTPKAKLKKQDTMRTFPAVTADIRGAATIDQLGVEQQFKLTANDRTKVDLDGAVAWIDPPGKNPSMRKWLTVEGL